MQKHCKRGRHGKHAKRWTKCTSAWRAIVHAATAVRTSLVTVLRVVAATTPPSAPISSTMKSIMAHFREFWTDKFPKLKNYSGFNSQKFSFFKYYRRKWKGQVLTVVKVIHLISDVRTVRCNFTSLLRFEFKDVCIWIQARLFLHNYVDRNYSKFFLKNFFSL